jgi:hypothetical protein
MAAPTASQNVGKTDKTTVNNTNVGVAASPSASQSVGRPTLLVGGSSGTPSIVVRVRLPLNVFEVLKASVSNVSGFIRGLVLDGLQRLPCVFENEMFLLEVEVACLVEELHTVHGWQKAVLKHGSYAEAYLKQLRGGVVVDRKPHFIAKPLPEIKPQELQTVQSIVEYREALTRQLVEKLNRLLELKKANLNLKEGGNRGEKET